jgi:hypothetical protein
MKSDMDNKEWLNDYPLLKQVAQNNPFKVPDGYFDELHQRTISRAILDGVNAETGFTVPENYFEEMQANLQSRINIEGTINNNTTGFTVPAGYFEDMQANLQSRINMEAALNNTTGDFTVPDNYFEDQHQQINSLIAVEELLNGQPQGFTVPDNYFDNLQNAILSKTAEARETVKPAAKRGGIVRRMFTSGAFKYATAACLVLGIGTTVFLNTYESPQARHNRSYIHKALVNVPDEDIIDYLQAHMDAADTRSLMEGSDQITVGSTGTDDLKQYLSTH